MLLDRWNRYDRTRPGARVPAVDRQPGRNVERADVHVRIVQDVIAWIWRGPSFCPGAATADFTSPTVEFDSSGR